jgi:hypothetical protein
LNKPFVLNEGIDLENYSLKDYFYDYFNPEVLEGIKQRMKILIHGIEIDLNLPLLFVYYNFSNLDQFLYITLAFKE